MNRKLLKIISIGCMLCISSIFIVQAINVKAEKNSYVHAQHLLDSILEKDNLNEILMYNRTDIAVDILINEYDEMKELMNSNEAVDVILVKYEKYNFK